LTSSRALRIHLPILPERYVWITFPAADGETLG
jgi:hypothetical protein